MKDIFKLLIGGGIASIVLVLFVVVMLQTPEENITKQQHPCYILYLQLIDVRDELVNSERFTPALLGEFQVLSNQFVAEYFCGERLHEWHETLDVQLDPLIRDYKSRTALIELPIDSFFTHTLPKELYDLTIGENKTYISSAFISIKPELSALYDEIGIRKEPQNTIVVFPIFTAAAYGEPGFYTYYRGECDASCLTLKLKDRNDYHWLYQWSGNAIQVLNLLGYKFITDLEIEEDPEILKDYDKVILLHNEYVTKKEFDAITAHPNVIYLYPNALYAEVEYDETSNTIKLIRGHSYPDRTIKNGFDWEFDNSILEYDDCLTTWEFTDVDNGIMLSCYPENVIHNDKELLQKIKEY